MTAEKEKAPVEDRMFVAEKAQQVLDCLANHNEFAELVQKGLKTMTHKQFIMILQLFLKPIVGTTVNIDVSNYSDYVYNLIISLEYPYSMNKSSLKTPSAPHCQNSIIVLLAWLTEFVVFEADQNAMEYCSTDELNSHDFTKEFMNKMGEAFMFWNNQDELEATKIQEMRQMYIDMKVGRDGNILTEIDRLKDSIEQLERESKPVSVMKELEEKIQESKQHKDKIKVLGRLNNELSDLITNIEAELISKQAAKATAAADLFNLRKQVSEQKMTQEERIKLLIEITELKSLLESKRADVMDLSEGSSEREIQLSNLIQKKFHLIEKLNNSIYTLASELQVAGMHQKFDPALFEIKTTNIGYALVLDTEIESFKRGLSELNEKHQHAIALFAKSKVEGESEKHKLVDEMNQVLEYCQKLKSSYEKSCHENILVEAELTDLINTFNQSFLKNGVKLEEINTKISKLKRNIDTYHKYNKQIITDKEAFKKKSLEECKSLFEKRKKEIQIKREKLDEMRKFLTEFANTQKPFSENVQRIITNVIKRRDKADDK